MRSFHVFVSLTLFVSIVVYVLVPKPERQNPDHDPIVLHENSGGRVFEGQVLEETLKVLNRNQAKEISDVVGVKPPVVAGKDVWFGTFVLKDRTAVQIIAYAPKGTKSFRVDQLLVGKKGEAYPGKLRWSDESRREKFLELSFHR